MNPDGPDDMCDGPDDILADSVRQWREQPVADGPSPVALTRTIERTRAAAGEAAASVPPLTTGAGARGRSSSRAPRAVLRVVRERVAGTSPWMRFAAAAVLVLGLIGGMMLLTERRAVAFADVKRQIQEARTLTYKLQMEQEGKP